MIIQVIPDNQINNARLDSLLTNIHTYKNLFQRINLKDKKIINQNKIVFEILFTSKDVSFYYLIPDELKDLVINELNVSYPKSTFKIKSDNIKTTIIDGKVNIEKTDHMIDITGARELELDMHSFLSIKVDKRGEWPLNSFLETSRVLKSDEKVLLQYILVPEEPSTNTEFSGYIEDFYNEKILKEPIKLNAKKIGLGISKIAYYGITEVLDLCSLLITDEEYPKLNLDELEYSQIFRNGLSQNTKDKATSLYYDTSIRIAVESPRADLISQLFMRGFNLLEEDNRLIDSKIKTETIIGNIIERKPSDRINKNILSTRELSQLFQLPTKVYQEEYKIKAIDTREINLPKEFNKNGIPICDIDYKGKNIPLKFPLDDPNSLCQCWISIGKMGSGKTTFGENTAIQMLNNGISVFAVDVADGRLIDNIENGLPKSFNKIIDLDFGDVKRPIPLAWTELASLGEDSMVENRMSSQLKNFLNKLAKTDQEKLSDRMERFLGAAAKAVFKNSKANLFDVILCITNREYRHKVIEDNKVEGRTKLTLLQLDDDKDKETGTKQSYINGIMDRIEALLDNDYVSNCLLQTPNPDINFRKWADEGYFVGIRVPKDTLLDDATDLLVTYIVSKLWLAILSRNNIPEKDRHPCVLILDEPHQFPTVFSELYSIVREMRKWHFGLFILAHEFKDFKGLKTLFKAAGTNYIIYPTSKETYKELLEELHPFTLEEMIATKWRHAIVSLRYKDKNICVMGNMNKPLPKLQDYKKVNIYGRDKNKVEEEIFSKSLL